MRDPSFLDAAADLVAPNRSTKVDAVQLFKMAGLDPDPWQVELLRSDARRIVVVAPRQSGKSEAGAGIAVAAALSMPRQTCVLAAPSQRQAMNVLDKARRLCNFAEVSADGNLLSLTFPNESKILAIPGTADTVRGITCHLYLEDESGFVPEAFYEAIIPMLGTTSGRIVLLSTPNDDAGYFYRAVTDGVPFDPSMPVESQPDAWHKIRVDYTRCSRLDLAVAEELRAANPRAFDREYLCKFVGSEGALFTAEQVAGLFDPSAPFASLVPR